ncbi:MAG: alpha/beta hydrolase [Deltaproteobacteria bacterium]|nr:MAG: alpha/beta hydrolase [Deltaproteobacteria bacterium]
MNPLDHHIISQRYFFPRQGSLPETYWVTSGEAQLACYRRHVDDNALTFVHFHGNGELVSDYLPDFADLIQDQPLNLCFVEYRGYGESTGVPQLAAMMDDTQAVFEALNLPASQLVVYGRSIGSIYAIEFARRYPNIAGLILESGIADPLERVLLRVSPEELGVTAQALQQAASETLNHQAKLASYSNPLLVLHTQYDGLVDVSHAERNHAWAASDDKTLHVFEHGDHNSIHHVNWPQYSRQLHNFFRKLAS